MDFNRISTTSYRNSIIRQNDIKEIIMALTNTLELSLIGLGLILALYTIISDRINDLQEKKIKEHLVLKNKEDNAISKLLTNKSDTEAKKELKSVWKKVEKITSGTEYHYNWGYFVSGIFFTVNLLSAFFIDFFSKYLTEKTITAIFIYSEIAVLVGLLNFLYIWVRTMLDMRALFRYKMEVIEESEKGKTIIPKTPPSLF